MLSNDVGLIRDLNLDFSLDGQAARVEFVEKGISIYCFKKPDTQSAVNFHSRA